MRAVIVANGDVDEAALRRVAAGDGRGAGDEPGDGPGDGSRGREGPTLVICADGGAIRATAAGVAPGLVIGDGDSLTASDVEALRRDGVTVRIVPAAKDQSDTELCVREAVERGADEIVLLGALGGPRIEHSVANLGLLALPELRATSAVIEHGPSRLRLLCGRDGTASLEVHGTAGDFVSLLPFGGDAEGVTTDGLLYPLDDEPLPLGPARGLSNELTGTRATVHVRDGRLLVIHTRRVGLERGPRGHGGPGRRDRT